MDESHLRDLPFEHGIKSLWKLVVCYRERELADLKYQMKKLNLCDWHILEARESPFAGLLISYTVDLTFHYSQRFAYKLVTLCI